MNKKAISIIAFIGLVAAILAATGQGERIRWIIWNRTRGELNSLPFLKRCHVAWRILWGKL